MRLIGLLLSAVILTGIISLLYDPKSAALTSSHEETSKGGGEGSSLGAPPPSDFGRNVHSSVAYTRSQMCLADCASELRTCKAVAVDPSAEAACDTNKSGCDKNCP